MTDQSLPDPDHLLRYVRKRSLIRKDGEVLGVLADAFKLKDNEVGLSAAWIEFHGGSADEQIAQSKTAFTKVLKIGPNDRFVRGQVRTIKGACFGFGCQVKIVRDPEPNFPSHAQVMNFRDEKDELLELLATEAWAEILDVTG